MRRSVSVFFGPLRVGRLAGADHRRTVQRVRHPSAHGTVVNNLVKRPDATALTQSAESGESPPPLGKTGEEWWANSSQRPSAIRRKTFVASARPPANPGRSTASELAGRSVSTFSTQVTTAI